MGNGNIENKRIARNSIALYFRMIFIILVGLFTSRVVLQALGVEDYGIYNVVGGFVTFFTFLNGAVTTATQRFLTFELAQGDLQRQRVTFSTSVIIHFSLGVVIVLLAETAGLWFVCNHLVIPPDRLNAALWVYQFSILSLFISIVSIPYNALIIAHEKMAAFAYISIFDVGMKLLIVYLIVIAPCDRLVSYAFLLCMVSALDRVIYGIYCNRHFLESKFKLAFDKGIFQNMSNIAGWSLFGNIAGVCYTQGLNILLNMFFGPAVNAARGIAVTVQGVLYNFVSNFQMALNPQITKSYAVGDLQRMHVLIVASSKYSFFLLFALMMPFIVEAPLILDMWLDKVPDYSVSFVRLILCIMLIETLANPLMVSSQAVAKVKVYQSVVGGVLLLILPISYLCLKLGGNPNVVFWVHLCIAVIAQLCRVVIVGCMIDLSLAMYFVKVIYPVSKVLVLSLIVSLGIYCIVPDSLAWDLAVMLFVFVMTLLVIVCIGLTAAEKKFVFEKVRILKR